MITANSLSEIPRNCRLAVQQKMTARGSAICRGDELPQTPAPTHEEMARLIAAPYAAAVQSMLDAEAQARSYDGILSMVSYAGDDNPKVGPEGTAAKAWRTACWTQCYMILAAVESGARPMPTVAELLAEMPALALP